MANEHILLILSDPEATRSLREGVLVPAGYRTTDVNEWKAAGYILQQRESPDLVIVSETLEDRSSSENVHSLMKRFPFLPVLLLPETLSKDGVVQAIRDGYFDCLQLPLQSDDVLQSVSRGLERRRRWIEQARLEVRQNTSSLKRRMDGLEAIERIGRKVTSLLDLDSVLTSVVDAAVELTAAEEGSLLLLDESTGELYIRAERNFQQEIVSTFRLPVSDPLAAQVLRTGKPLLINEKTPQKIKTSFFVHTLLYVPLMVQEHAIGMLEVDHRQRGKSFNNDHVTMLLALADYAAIAIENARLYSHSESERLRLESILTGIEEAVVVVDHDHRLVLINHKACEAFGITEQNVIGRRVREVVPASELLEILVDPNPTVPSRIELSLEDGRVLNAQITALPEIGLVVTMQDITHLKELDRIKSDFVNTVSHDLRSPLTAILGYVELIGRVGSLNPQQHEFIHRIEISVHNITALINDLLDLGRIEAGFDVRKEVVPLATLIQYTVDSMKNRFAEKSQTPAMIIADNLPAVLGNPIRLRQMLNNLITNSIKYTPVGGTVTISAHSEAGQIILQVSDNGPGIPPADQPYIFDKFYRASNVPLDAPGTGLGLAIVKSIVENHLGRVWVDSALGQGSTFTIVLPVVDQDL
jgi:two-component system, OmpR family, phosphate regulon sensor histidine kinase PhoR